MKVELIKLKDTQKIYPTENAQYVLIPNKNNQGPVDFTLEFEKEGVSCEILFLHNLTLGQRLDLQITAHHKTPRTSCVTNVKGILGDNATFNFVGKILIDKQAQQTASYLYDRVLVVGEGTRASSQPILQIDANDVSASHGATTSRINEEETFYLCSRGLSTGEAEKQIAAGFMQALVSRIQDEKIKQYVIKELGL